MGRFGRSPFARRFGGRSVEDIEHRAMLNALEPGYDVSPDSAVYAETYAHAVTVASIWRVNGRLKNFRVPLKMMESLPVWEEACKLRPKATDSAPARRRALAAKMRGFVGNKLSDIYDVCATAAGANFLGIAFSDPAYVYQPGLNPGPPGFEWTSARAKIAIELSRDNLSNADFFALVQRLTEQLHILVPGWMTFRVGTDEGGFICDIGIVDVTLLEP